MGAIVLLIAAEEIPKKFNFDYLVDIAIHLKQSHLDKPYEKPVRILELVKTRHQLSRQGSHIFHISNSRGFRISPQIPSQIDKKEKVKIKLPSDSEYIHTLNFIQEKDITKFVNFLPIAINSHILVHGYGSSGKAGFGLKLLLTPYLPKHINLNSIDKISIKISHSYSNKVLIVSFLYPVEYYDILVHKINKQFTALFENFNVKKGQQYFVKAFFPGYLTPEDFIYKLVRLLDEANLEGQPFTGILLDGLHNVFLQFKSLQESHMIWPLLYSILSRYNLTVVSTFTNFSLDERHIDKNSLDNRTSFQTPDDFALMQQGQRPFLHGLVKAADYYFLLEEIIDDNNSFARNYWLSVRSSIRQTPPKNFAI